MGMESKVEEVLVTRITVINPSPVSVPLPHKYRCLFHGAGALRYGRHVIRFPIGNLGYKRLVSSFQSDFKGKLKVDFGVSGIDEV